MAHGTHRRPTAVASGSRSRLRRAPSPEEPSSGRGISCGPFLSRVAAALAAKEGAKAAQVDRMEFGAAILGADLRRETMGGFSGKGGGWTATKLFDYGPDVLRVLASVLGNP